MNKKIFISVFVFSILATIAFVFPVGAISRDGPGSGVTALSGSPASNYILVKSPNTGDLSDSIIPIYKFNSAPTSNVSVEFQSPRCGSNYSTCTGGSGYNQRAQVYYLNSNGDYTSISRLNTETSFNIPRGAFIKDNSTGTYKATLKFVLRNGNNNNSASNTFRNRIGFKLRAPNNYYIGNSNSSSSDLNIISSTPNAANSTAGNSYRIAMATPCSVTSATTKTIKFRDVDSGHADNANKVVTITVQYQMSNGTFRSVEYDTATKNKYKLTRSGSMNNGSTYNLKMNFQPKDKYRIIIKGLANINMIQYSLPYESVNYVNNCSWNLGVKSYVSAKDKDWGSTANNTIEAEIGQTVYFGHIISNEGTMKSVSKRSLQVRDYSKSNWTTSSTYPLNANIDFSESILRPTESSDRSHKIPAGAAIGSTYCQRYKVEPRSSSNSNAFTTSGACVKVKASPPSGWSVTPNTTASKLVAAPGDNITWTHSIVNTGPVATNAAVSYKPFNSGSTSSISNGWSINSGWAINSNRFNTTSLTIDQSHVGSSICRFTRVSPYSNTTGSNNRDSATACVSVPYSYTLTPQKPDILVSTIESGATVVSGQVTGRVSNSGPTKSHPSGTQSTLTMFLAPRGVSLDGIRANNNLSPLNHLGSRSPRSIGTNNSQIGNGSTITVTGNSFTSYDDLQVGDRVCFITSVTRRNQDGGWAHSDPTCSVVGKKPKVNIFGGSLAVGAAGQTNTGAVSTSTSSANNTTYGSYVEYAILATGRVVGMASAEGYSGGRSSSSSLCDLSLLTFGNVLNGNCSINNIGSYKGLSSATSIGGSFTGGVSASPIINVANLDSGIYNPTGDVTLSGGEIGLGKSIIINAPNRDVTISGDISYSSSRLSSVKDIPQLVILAKNIYIKDNVSRIDSWLYAEGGEGDGYINTCVTDSNITPLSKKAMGQDLNDTVCSRKLTVNGPVSARQLLLRRTFGSNPTDRSAVAESFNFRPDAYLWSLNRAGVGVNLPTAITKELPPRY